MSPKSARYIKLMNTVAEMNEDRLNVFENPDVVISTAIALIILQFIDDLEAN
jgi:hypothetical protein